MKTKDQIKNVRTNRAIVYLYEKGYRAEENGAIINPRGKEIGFNRGDGRYVIMANFEDKITTILRSRFVAYCKFKEDMFNVGMMVRHKNDNPSDDSFKNILIGTNYENIKDAKRNNIKLGRPKKGDEIDDSKLYISWKTVGFSKTMKRHNVNCSKLTRCINRYNPTAKDKIKIFWRNLI